jgi:diguanylate cyclase (GGDEF)-like protein
MAQMEKNQIEKNRWGNCSTRERLVGDLEAEIARAKRYVKPLALLMTSIDWYGGENRKIEGGEEQRLMNRTVDALTKNMRIIDRVYLYEKGIFAILLPETDKVEALSTAKRLQKIIQLEKFFSAGQNNHHPLKPIVYIGIVSYPWDANIPVEMFKAAKYALDEALRSNQGHICFLDFEYQHLRDGSQSSYKVRSV